MSAVNSVKGATYRITVQNPDGVEKGVRSVTVNGRPCERGLVPVMPQGSENTVTVVMG